MTGSRPSSNPVKSPGMAGAFSFGPPLNHVDVSQQRDHAEDDDNDTANLFGAAVNRQQVDEVENENNDEKCDEYADKHVGPLGEKCAV
jgi:hypothetical protein